MVYRVMGPLKPWKEFPADSDKVAAEELNRLWDMGTFGICTDRQRNPVWKAITLVKMDPEGGKIGTPIPKTVT